MANSLALANISGLTQQQNGIDRNAVIVYEREKRIRYTVTLSGAYVQHVRGSATGEILDLTKPLTGGNSFQSNQFWGQKGPVRGYLINPGGTGYSMSIVPGADAFHWQLVIYSGVATELAAGNYPAGLTTDTDIVVEFTGQNFD